MPLKVAEVAVAEVVEEMTRCPALNMTLCWGDLRPHSKKRMHRKQKRKQQMLDLL